MLEANFSRDTDFFDPKVVTVQKVDIPFEINFQFNLGNLATSSFLVNTNIVNGSSFIFAETVPISLIESQNEADLNSYKFFKSDKDSKISPFMINEGLTQ